ncbi:hypothetical protein [Xenorhabdus bovienii]|nr:hypothetical protein [Xenorhabdus bovienii]
MSPRLRLKRKCACTMQEILSIKRLKVVLREKGHAIRSLEFEM